MYEERTSAEYELQNRPPPLSNASSNSALKVNRHPKITVYRLLLTLLTIGFGVGKAIASHNNASTAAPTTLEWVFGIVVTLGMYWTGLYDSQRQSESKKNWLFDFDCGYFVVKQVVRIFVPSYGLGQDSFPASNDIPHFGNTPPTSDPGIIPSWHPKITVYRLLLTALTIGFGVGKAVTTYKDESSTPTTLEWVFGVVVTICMYWIGLYDTSRENQSRTMIPWLFDFDCAYFILKHTARIFSLQPPSYRTDERSAAMLIERPDPPLTGYRLLVISTALSFGLTKATLTYLDKYSVVTNTLDWTFGVVIVMTLYWLGQYEYSSTQVLPWLFEIDYSDNVNAGASTVGNRAYIIGMHLFWLGALAMTAFWTYGWGYTLSTLWKSLLNGELREQNPGWSKGGIWVFSIVWSLFACAAVIAGTGGCAYFSIKVFEQLVQLGSLTVAWVVHAISMLVDWFDRRKDLSRR